jgi:hypothetical protein
MLRVAHAEPEHAVVRRVPELAPVLRRHVEVGLRRYAALAVGVVAVVEAPRVLERPLVVATASIMRFMDTDPSICVRRNGTIGFSERTLPPCTAPSRRRARFARELVPLGEEAIGVGEVTDVEHGVVVGQVLDQPVGGHLRPGLEAGELVAPVTLPLPNENASSFTYDGWMPRLRHKKIAQILVQRILTSPMSPKTTTP